jgi:CheY-like chemotaxis protein
MHSASGDGIHLDGLQVLSVDDDADTLYLVRTLLEDAGAVVATSQDAREALEIFQSDTGAGREDASGGADLLEYRGGSRAHPSSGLPTSHCEAVHAGNAGGRDRGPGDQGVNWPLRPVCVEADGLASTARLISVWTKVQYPA